MTPHSPLDQRRLHEQNHIWISTIARRRLASAAFTGFLAAGFCGVLAVHAAQPRTNARTRNSTATLTPEYVPDELLVRLRPGISKERAASIHAGVAAKVLRVFASVEGLQLVKLRPGIAVNEAIKEYREDADVLYAEPNYIVRMSAIPNDPRFPEQWNLQVPAPIPWGISAPSAWDITTGSSNVVVAVLDTGIDYNHQDLSSNMFRNTADCNTNGSDDDGNGYVDDCYGINPLNNTANPLDDNGHGTALAGVIGAAGNNGRGISGVNWQVGLMACKWINAQGEGSLSGALTCFDYVAMMKDRGVNIVATNNSWGSSQYSQALFDTLEVQWQKGILCIAAAGNDSSNNDAQPFYPANIYLPNVISVAATDTNGLIVYWSNLGPHTVHLGAPGDYILSTVLNNGYDLLSGTSLAAPHVAGVAALLKAQNPALDWKTIKNLILAGGNNSPVWTISTITRKVLDAYGSLTCSDSPVIARLQPTLDNVTAYAGMPLDLAVLNINCAQPNGEVQVTVQGADQTVTLLDDGAPPDQEAGDGIYSGQWVPPFAGNFTLRFPVDEYYPVTVNVLGHYDFFTAPFNYRNIAGTNLNLDGSSAPCITPPFINFAGSWFYNICISGNGVLSLSSAFNQSANQSIPIPFATNLIAPFWDSLSPTSGTEQNVFWDVTGTWPNREFVVEWRDVRHYDCRTDSTATVKFQVVFFESSSDILFNYADTGFGGACAFADQGASATVGVQVASNFGTQFSFDSPSLSDGSAILWHTPSAVSLRPASLTFFDQRVGTTSYDQAVALRNLSGVPVAISGITTSGDFSQWNNCGTTLYANGDCGIYVSFSPTTTGARTGTLTITDDALGNPHIVPLSGNGYDGVGPVINLSPASLTFGEQLSGTASPPQSVALTNTGDAGLGIWSIYTSDGNFGQTNNCGPLPHQISPGAGCTIDVSFTPSGMGTLNSWLEIVHTVPDGGGSLDTVALTGTAIAPLADVLPAQLTFPDQPVGVPSEPQTIALTNTGTAPLTFTGINMPADFIETNNCGTTLAVGDSCTISVTFIPTGPYYLSEWLEVVDNSLYGHQQVWLNGRGLVSFALAANPDTVTIVRGDDSATFNVSASSQYGYTGSITLSCWGDAGRCSASPTVVTPGQSSVLTVTGLSAAPFSTVNAGVQGASGNQYVTLPLKILIGDFSIYSTPTSATVSAGQSANYSLTLTPTNGFNRTVTLSCTKVPKATTCSFSPASITLDGTNPGSVELTVHTTARSLAMPRGGSRFGLRLFPLWTYGVWLLALLLISCLWVLRRRRAYLVAAAGLALAVTWAACGGGSTGPPPPTNGTPPGTYWIAVSATSGNFSLNYSVKLVVN